MIFGYSILSSFDRCAKSFKLKHIDNIPEPMTYSGDLAFGTSLHQALSSMFEGDDALSQFRVSWSIVDHKNLNWGRFDYHKLGEMGEVFLSRFERLHKKHFEPLHIEKKLKVKIKGFDVEGTPDMLGMYKGKRSVIDWKTSSGPYDKRKIIVGEQMPLYGYMAKEAYQYNVEQYVYVVFCKAEERIQVLTQDFAPKVEKEVIDNMTLKMADIVNRTAWPKNTNNCLNCGYFKHCYGEK